MMTQTSLHHAVHSICYLAGHTDTLCGLDVGDVLEVDPPADVAMVPCVVCFDPKIRCNNCGEDVNVGRDN